MPSRSVATTKASKSSMVPSSGWTAVWPPASAPMAHGLPGSPDGRCACCSGPCVRCGRWGGSAAGTPRRTPSPPPRRAGRRRRAGRPPSGEELVPGPHERPLAVDPQGMGLGGGAVGRRVLAGGRVVAPDGALAGDPCLDDQLVPAQVGGLDDGFPAVEAGLHEAHRLLPPFAVADGPPAHPSGEGVVAVLEDGGGDGDGLADHRLRRIAPGRGARAHVVDDDAADHPP